MNRNDPAASFDEPFERGLFAFGHETRVAHVEEQHVGVLKFGGAGSVRKQIVVEPELVVRESTQAIQTVKQPIREHKNDLSR